ncbi:hypothetical protein EBR96_07305, partial [bacterium]|nr:hypothetical protein [bacterium]
MSAEQVAAASDAISQRLFEWIRLQDYQSLAVYYPTQNEPNLLALYRQLDDLNIRLYLPVSTGVPEQPYALGEWPGAEPSFLKQGPFGTREPASAPINVTA